VNNEHARAGLRRKQGFVAAAVVPLVAIACAATACAAQSDPEADDAPNAFSLASLAPTTPDEHNPWMKGVDPSRLKIGEEVRLPDEDAMFQDMVSSIHQMQDAMASKNGGVGRAFHQKPHACLLGELHVSPPPRPEMAVGLFAKAATYPTWIRLSNGRGIKQADKAPDVQGVALKVMKVPGTKLLAGEESAVTQDFLAISSSVQPTADVQHFIQFQSAVTEAERLGEDPSLHLGSDLTLKFPGLDLGPLNRLFAQGAFLMNPDNRRTVNFFVLHAVPTALTHGSMLGEQFFSGGAIALGLNAGDPMKASARQAAEFRFVGGELANGSCRPVTQSPDRSDDNYYRSDLTRRLRAGVGCFDVQLQLQNDASKQFIEDASVEWREADSPFVSVGFVTVEATDLGAEGVKAQEDFCEGLGFTPWHTLPEHRPLGNMMRARRVVYEGSRQHRAGRDEPTGDEFTTTAP
jgi:hypothetical protein